MEVIEGIFILSNIILEMQKRFLQNKRGLNSRKYHFVHIPTTIEDSHCLQATNKRSTDKQEKHKREAQTVAVAQIIGFL